MTFDPINDAVAKSADDAAVPQSAVPVESPPHVLSYATPSAYVPGPWHWGFYVVVNPSSDLPDRCVKCNGATSERIPLRTRGAWALQFTPGQKWRVRIIRERGALLHIGLCRRHALEWRALRIVTGLLSVGLGVVLLPFLWASKHSSDWVAACVLGAFLLWAFCCSVIHKPLHIHSRDANGIWILYAGRRFRNSLQPLELPKRGLWSWLRREI